jgi:NAD(P)-dependent dehydrogenase (short-subunit alcohol dehydrogenase family)
MALLTGKVVLIRGASRGIGAAAARLFAREGAAVVLAARSAASLQRPDGAAPRRARSRRESVPLTLALARIRSIASQNGPGL